MRLEEAERIVAPILAAVRERGDAALLEYARKFDGFEGASVRIDVRGTLQPAFAKAVEIAAKNIREYAEAQLPREWFTDFPDGRRLGQIVRPLDAMGAYVPAGRYPLPSTLLMTVIPAQVAGVADHLRGVPESQPGNHGHRAMAGSHAHVPHGRRAGHRRAGLWNRDGAESRSHRRPRQYICCRREETDRGRDRHRLRRRARRRSSSSPPMATRAGSPPICWRKPSTMWTRRPSCSPRRAVLAEAVAKEVDAQLATLPTAAVARPSIETNGAIVVLDTLDQAVEMSNALAPEHLALHDGSLLAKIRHAGAVFVGAASPESAGDYASGPNHVLPTSGAARQRGGLSAADFVKVIAVQELSREGLAKLTPAIAALARAEGLEAHARSAEVRNE